MNKNELLELQNKRNKLINTYIYLGIAIVVMIPAIILSVNYLIDLLNAEKTYLSPIIYTMSMFLVILIILSFFFLMKKILMNSKEIDEFVSINEGRLIEEGFINEYEIVDFVVIENKNNHSNKIPFYQTKSFNEETKLVEVTYLKDDIKHKLLTEVAILSQQPKTIKYMEFEHSIYYKNNVMYNIVCE